MGGAVVLGLAFFCCLRRHKKKRATRQRIAEDRARHMRRARSNEVKDRFTRRVDVVGRGLPTMPAPGPPSAAVSGRTERTAPTAAAGTHRGSLVSRASRQSLLVAMRAARSLGSAPSTGKTTTSATGPRRAQKLWSRAQSKLRAYGSFLGGIPTSPTKQQPAPGPPTTAVAGESLRRSLAGGEDKGPRQRSTEAANRWRRAGKKLRTFGSFLRAVHSSRPTIKQESSKKGKRVSSLQRMINRRNSTSSRLSERRDSTTSVGSTAQEMLRIRREHELEQRIVAVTQKANRDKQKANLQRRLQLRDTVRSNKGRHPAARRNSVIDESQRIQLEHELEKFQLESAMEANRKNQQRRAARKIKQQQKARRDTMLKRRSTEKVSRRTTRIESSWGGTPAEELRVVPTRATQDNLRRAAGPRLGDHPTAGPAAAGLGGIEEEGRATPTRSSRRRNSVSAMSVHRDRKPRRQRRASVGGGVSEDERRTRPTLSSLPSFNSRALLFQQEDAAKSADSFQRHAEGGRATMEADDFDRRALL